jgi:hypothetical protein
LSVLVFASPGQPQSSGVAPNPKHWTQEYVAGHSRKFRVTADVYCTPDKKGTRYTIEEFLPVSDTEIAWVTLKSGFIKGAPDLL